MTEGLKIGGLPPPFGFYRKILGGDHLHFGLWDDEANLPMEAAQERMFNRLVSFFPAPPASVLDVGCGLGYSSSLLARQGYDVTAITPSPELIVYAREKYGEAGVAFKEAAFLDEDPLLAPGTYDVLFFQESMQYLSPLDDVMKKARGLLKERGLLILSDEVCYDRSIKAETAVHMARDFVTALSENGFRIMVHELIGEKVLSTCGFVIDAFTEHFDEIVSTSDDQGVCEKLRFFLEGWKRQRTWYTSGQMGYEIFVGKKDGFFMKPYAPGDEHTILPMFNEVFHVNRTMEHWYWKFRDNPYGSHKISEAIAEDGRLTAHYAGYPVPFHVASGRPETFISYQIGDTMTRPEVRNIGLGKTGLLARVADHFYAKFCEGVPFTYGFNTGNIRKLGIRYLGYTYISPVTYWVRDSLKSLPKGSLFKRLLSGFTVEEVSSVDGEWDAFFSRVCAPYRFLVRRDAAYVRWRYLDCPDRVHRIFSVRRRGRLIGWGVVVQRGEKLIWGDALFDRRYPEFLSYFLGTLTRDYFPEAATIEGWFSRHPEWWSGLLERSGFAVVPEPNDLTPGFVIFGDGSMKAKLEEDLYYTWGDSDLF